LPNSEYISLDDVKALNERGEQVVVIDARTERSYEESKEDIPGALRLAPDDAVRLAGQLGISKKPVLAVLCA
jgi:rhodanese-related sulfurtransferase